jgi:hypothetical protein
MRQLAMGGGALGGAGADVNVVDTAETVYISSQALLKMLKHGARSRERVPLAPSGAPHPSTAPSCSGFPCHCRAGGRAHGGHGAYAGRVRGRLHRSRCGRLRHAPERHGR